ncbi:RNA binding protein [Plasmodium cynomolgi strain B]|uniref:RNA binding protein n=1 Tax=Plasmodium cynomolgi (strain B) TaxID=1120755 RepID=K6UTM5_PLACD|nr:RNA binding protein [Plasmodium cynomolgi strain B]GAB66664.1 RNA binding protein [Plasmodium cynomolgi strain B]
MKSDYYNEGSMNEFSLDEVASQYIFSPKDYLGNSLNGEVLGMNGHMEKMQYASSLLGEMAGDRYSQHSARLPSGVIVAPPLMYDNCNGHAGHQNNDSTATHADFGNGWTHADFGSTSVHGNVRSTTVHTDNNGQEEENETMSTLVNAFTLKREENYYQNGSEMMRANEMSKTNSVNIADVSSVFNSNSCSLSNGNGRNMNNNSNVSSSHFPGKAAKGSNTSIFRTYDMVSPKDGIQNGAYGGHINGSIGGSIRGSNNQQGEKSGIGNGVENGVDNGIENGIGNGIENEIGNGIGNGIENGVGNGIENEIGNGIENGIENENEEPVIKLFFGNLAPITTEKDMHNLFSNFGKCDSLIILKDRRSKSRGSGFVTFYNMQEAVNAIKSLNNKIILSGAHKPLEVRFPENKEEKKLRTKLLNAAKWKGKKIAPSGCLPISTEDILNQSSLHMNNGPGGGGGSPGGNHRQPFLTPMETPSYFLTENEGPLYDIKETVSFGCTSGGMMDCANANMLKRTNANHYACSEDFSELRKTASETTNDTLLTDYVNRVEEGSNFCSSSRHNSYKKEQDNLLDDMNNMSLSKQRKEYSKFLPNFLLDNNPYGKNVASNSFQSLDEALGNIRKFSLDVDMEEVNVGSNGFVGALEVNGGLGRKVVHEIVHEKVPGLRSESGTVEEDSSCRHDSIGSARSFCKGDVQNASGAKATPSNLPPRSFNSRSFNSSSFNSSGRVMEEGDEANSYFSSFCHGFPVESKIMEDPNNTFFSYLNKDKSLANHNKGEEEVYQHKMDFCRKGGDFPGINELEEINHFRQLTELEEVSEAYERERSENDMRNVLLRGSEEMAEVGKEENLLSDIYEGNKGMASPPMNDDEYSNMNVHYLGFDLSRLIQINEDILLPQKEDMKKNSSSSKSNNNSSSKSNSNSNNNSSNNSNNNSSNSDNTNSNVGSTSQEVMEVGHMNGKEIMTTDFYQHRRRWRSSSSSSGSNDGNHMYKLHVGHAHGTMDLLNDDLFGNKNFDLNDNLSDEMLRNLISLYAQNKSSMITSHVFSYLNNVLCEINSALEIFNKFGVKTSMKNIAEEESLPE